MFYEHVCEFTTGSIYYNYYNRLILCLDCSFCVKCTIVITQLAMIRLYWRNTNKLKLCYCVDNLRGVWYPM